MRAPSGHRQSVQPLRKRAAPPVRDAEKEPPLGSGADPNRQCRSRVQLLWLGALVWYRAYPRIALAVAVRSQSLVRTLDPIAGLELAVSIGRPFLGSRDLWCSHRRPRYPRRGA